MSEFVPVLCPPKPKRPPKRHRFSDEPFWEPPRLIQSWPVPVAKKASDTWPCFSGTLPSKESTEVVVSDPDAATALFSMGYFGTTDLERGRGDPCEWALVEEVNPAPSEAVPKGAEQAQGARETKPWRSGEDPSQVYLEPCEAFFLSYALACLTISGPSGEDLDLDALWRLFRAADPRFPRRYRAYHHFRAKGWVVRRGTKYGADFLLYKDGPPFYHASYVVRVGGAGSWAELSGLNRVAEAAGKEVVVAEVEGGTQESESPPSGFLQSLSVNEVLVRRWLPSQERLKEEDFARVKSKAGKGRGEKEGASSSEGGKRPAPRKARSWAELKRQESVEVKGEEKRHLDSKPQKKTSSLKNRV